MGQLNDIAIYAASKLLNRSGYDVIDADASTGIVAAFDGCTLVFTEARARYGSDEGLPEGSGESRRDRMESVAAKWLAEHASDASLDDARVRFDEISVCVINDSRVFLRHVVDCLGVA